MKIGIVGSRVYPHRQEVVDFVNSLPDDTIIVSGGCSKGPDRWAEETAKKRGMKTLIFPADWKQYGKSAGFARNHLIVEACDELVAFHAKKSRGTAHSIELARQAGKRVTVRRPFGERGDE